MQTLPRSGKFASFENKNCFLGQGIEAWEMGSLFVLKWNQVRALREGREIKLDNTNMELEKKRYCNGGGYEWGDILSNVKNF